MSAKSRCPGTAPAGFDAACRPVVYRKDGVHFSFLRFLDPSASRPVQEIAFKVPRMPQPSPQPARLEDVKSRGGARGATSAHFAGAAGAPSRGSAGNNRSAPSALAANASKNSVCWRRRAAGSQFNAMRAENTMSRLAPLPWGLPEASAQDAADLRSWRGIAEKFRVDFDSCRAGSGRRGAHPLASQAVAPEQRPLLEQWRVAASPFNRAMALLSSRAGMVARAAIDGLNGARNLPPSPQVTGGAAAVLALALAAMALRRAVRLIAASGCRQPPMSPTSDMAGSTIYGTRSGVLLLARISLHAGIVAVIPHRAPPAAAMLPAARFEALELAHAYVQEVRDADTPTREDREVRKRHLDKLALASKQLDAARRRDPDAILEGEDEKRKESPTASASTS